MISQNLFVNLNDSLGDRRAGQMLYVLPPARPLTVAQNISETLAEFLHVRLANVTPVRVANNFADITHIGGHNRQIAGHGLLHNVGRAFLIGSKYEGVARIHEERQAVLRLLMDDQQFDLKILSSQAVRDLLCQRKALDRYVWAGREQQVFFLEIQAQRDSSLFAVHGPKEFEIYFMRDDVNVFFSF